MKPLDPLNTLDVTGQGYATDTTWWRYLVTALTGGGIVQGLNMLMRWRSSSADADQTRAATTVTVAEAWRELYEEMRTRVDALEDEVREIERQRDECKREIAVVMAKYEDLARRLGRVERNGGSGEHEAQEEETA